MRIGSPTPMRQPTWVVPMYPEIGWDQGENEHVSYGTATAALVLLADFFPLARGIS